jgi:hypothetical protein
MYVAIRPSAYGPDHGEVIKAAVVGVDGCVFAATSPAVLGVNTFVTTGLPTGVPLYFAFTQDAPAFDNKAKNTALTGGVAGAPGTVPMWFEDQYGQNSSLAYTDLGDGNFRLDLNPGGASSRRRLRHRLGNDFPYLNIGDRVLFTICVDMINDDDGGNIVFALDPDGVRVDYLYGTVLPKAQGTIGALYTVTADTYGGGMLFGQGCNSADTRAPGYSRPASFLWPDPGESVANPELRYSNAGIPFGWYLTGSGEADPANNATLYRSDGYGFHVDAIAASFDIRYSLHAHNPALVVGETYEFRITATNRGAAIPDMYATVFGYDGVAGITVESASPALAVGETKEVSIRFTIDASAWSMFVTLGASAAEKISFSSPVLARVN